MKGAPDPRPLEARNYPGKPLQETLYYRFLYELALEMKPAIIVEIGTRRGESAIQFSFGCPSAKIFTIDIDKKSADYIAAFRRPNINFILMDSGVAIEQVRSEAPWDILFIDSDHSYETASTEYKLYFPFVRPGGVIALDDIHFNEGMDKFWSEIPQPKMELNHLHVKGFGVVVKQ